MLIVLGRRRPCSSSRSWRRRRGGLAFAASPAPLPRRDEQPAVVGGGAAAPRASASRFSTFDLRPQAQPSQARPPPTLSDGLFVEQDGELDQAAGEGEEEDENARLDWDYSRTEVSTPFFSLDRYADCAV